MVPIARISVMVTLDKPFYDSTARGAWYAAVRVAEATGYNLSFSSANKGDNNHLYEVLGYRSHSYRHFCWAVGLSAYYGRYRIR